MGIEGLDPDVSKEFLEWAAGYDDPSFESRSLRSQEAWLERLRTPVLRLVTSQPVEELCRRVLDWEPGPSASR